MSWLVRFVRSSIGAKIVMALSGFGLYLFVLQHMIAQWLIFAGPDAMNAYAYNLKNMPLVLWGGRAGIILAFVVHILSGVRLAYLQRQARPQAYAMKKAVRASLASRTMVLSGLVVLAYLVYHLLHFTLGVTNPADFEVKDPLGRHDVFRMMVLGFQQPAIVVAYVIANVLVGLHLWHGVSSMFQTLGITRPKKLVGGIGPFFGLTIAAGFITVPLAVLFGYVHL
jgi:succinate dehydrogenase / fumarate reductase, cytochrome b subunit